MQNAEGVFVANLLCYSSGEEEAIHVLDGEDCALQFLHDLDDLVNVPDSDEVVDGYDALTRTVYEFHGCIYHGCPTCFPRRWLCMSWPRRARKYATWMSPPFYPWVNKNCPYPIRRSSLNPSTNPWGCILVSPPSTFFHLLVCFTLSCPCVAVTNSSFLCVVSVSRRSRPNPC